MESLFNYGSEEENDDALDNDGVNRAESDTNYDHVTMDMSDDSSSSVNGCGQIITDRIGNEDGISGEIRAPEVTEVDKSSGFSSSDSCCSSENDFTSIRDKLFREKNKNNKSSPDYKSYSGEKCCDNKLDNSKRQSQQRTSFSKFSSRDISGHDSNEANSDEDDGDCDYEDDDEIAKYRDREGRNRDRDRDRERDRKRHRSRSRERSHLHERHRSRSPTSDRHHSNSKHYSHRSRHSMSRERDNRSRNRSRSREKSRSSYESKRQNKLTILEKLGIELKVPDGGGMTPQIALQKSMEEQITKVKNATGISLPSYYNPIAVNPTRYAEQMQKRKLLWGGNQKQVNNQTRAGKESNITGPAGSAIGSAAGPASLWQGARFSQDQDGKLMAKFKRLMGIKQVSGEGSSGEGGTGTDLIKKQEEMFNSMEMQYEVARVATHTHRGLGLGFGVHQYPR